MTSFCIGPSKGCFIILLFEATSHMFASIALRKTSNSGFAIYELLFLTSLTNRNSRTASRIAR